MLRPVLIALSFAAVSACASQSAPPPISNSGASGGYAVTINNPNVWRDIGTGIQHIETQITCPGQIGMFRLTDIREFPSSAVGENVSCGFSGPNGETVSYYLTTAQSFIRPTSERAHFRQSIENIKEAMPVIGEIDLPLPSAGIPPAALAAGYQTTLSMKAVPDAPIDTALWLDQIGDWHVKVRATYPHMSAPQIVEFVSGLYSAARLTLPGGTT